MAMREIKLCLLGDSGVGKSSIVQRFVMESFRPNMESTVGASFMSKTMIVDDQAFKFHIWDTAGQEKYRSLAPMYYRGASAAIIVYDITKETSFMSLQEWIGELEENGPDNIVLAIAGNKDDLSAQREVPQECASMYADEKEALFIETSAKTARNISHLFEQICAKLPPEALPPNKIGTLSLQRPPSYYQRRKCCSGNNGDY